MPLSFTELTADSTSAETEKTSQAEMAAGLRHILEKSDGLTRIRDLIRALEERFLERRIQALRDYLELPPGESRPRINRRIQTMISQAADKLLANAQSSGDLAQPRTGIVFTAHPTFALFPEIYQKIAEETGGRKKEGSAAVSHRRTAPPLIEEERETASAAIINARNALDLLSVEILKKAQARFKNAKIRPLPGLVASWVGFDTDGRNDIHWWDSIRIRLEMKRDEYRRLQKILESLGLGESRLHQRIQMAHKTVKMQIAGCLDFRTATPPPPKSIEKMAQTLIKTSQDALANIQNLQPLFEEALRELPEAQAARLTAVWSGALGHGLGISRIHTRLNAAQIYNVARTRLGLTDDPAIPTHRQVLISHLNRALETLKPLPLSFGDLLLEASAAARLMMTMAQILKHIDCSAPIRFLIAETESGYTLLATLWLARLFGIPDHLIEISPLFETESALENGGDILEEAFQSPHWREYISRNGRLCLQFGYSDSGRYIGQIPISPLVERLREKAVDLLKRYGLSHIELVFFDTHGETIGRGAHPDSLRQRLRYFSSPQTLKTLRDAGVIWRQETSFQGGDGFLFFQTPALAAASTALLVSEGVACRGENTDTELSGDIFYDRPLISADFFATISHKMSQLLSDPGYAALLSIFGPNLLDKTGSRPSARHNEGARRTVISHPRQMRAIPNNAILLQLGWWVNLLHGLGSAADRHPETFKLLKKNSPRFRLLLDFCAQAMRHSDLDVLEEMITLLDPGLWMRKAQEEPDSGEKRRLLALAEGLESLDFWRTGPALFRKIQRDYILLQTHWPDMPEMAQDEKLVHAIRRVLIEKLWRLAARIPYFAPRGTVTREAIIRLILTLDIPRALALLRDLFPEAHSPIEELDFGETGRAAEAQGFEREHQEIFRPMEEIFGLIRECSVLLQHGNRGFA